MTKIVISTHTFNLNSIQHFVGNYSESNQIKSNQSGCLEMTRKREGKSIEYFEDYLELS